MLCAKFIGNNSPCSLFLNGLLRSNRNAYFQWRLRDSNSRPPACKAGALPTELSPRLIWQPPALPYRLQYSTIGRLGLNHRVRDENGCVPQAHRHQKSCSWSSASCRPLVFFINASHLFHGLPASYTSVSFPSSVSKLTRCSPIHLCTRLLTTKQ